MNDPDLPFGLLILILLAALGYAMLSMTQKHRKTLPFQLKLFFCAIGVRFLISIVLYQFGVVQVIGDEDSSGWLVGSAFYSDWIKRGVGVFELPAVLADAYFLHDKGYYYLVGTLFYFTGVPARLPAAALNCFFGGIGVVFAYRTARTLFSEWVAVRVGWWLCLLPSMLIWSAQTIKEPVVIMLEIIALYACVQLRTAGFSLRYIFLAAAAILLIIPFRFYAAYIAVAAVGLALFVPHLGRRKMTILPGLIILAAFIGSAVFFGFMAKHETEFEKFDLQYVQKFKTYTARTTGSGVESTYDLNTPGGFSMSLGVGAAHLLLAPFPWELGGASLRMALTLPELLIWWWLFFRGVAPGFWYLIRKRFGDILPMLFFLFGLGFLYSLMFANVGLVFRQRAQLLPWLIMFAMVGFERKAIRKLIARRARASAPPLAIAQRP